jgi:neutral ceramidase
VSRPRRAALVLGGLLVLALVLAGVPDWCSGRATTAPRVRITAQVNGPLRAGAAATPMALPLPAVVAGYGVPRATVDREMMPLQARALLVEASGVRVGLVSLDLLVGDAELDRAIRSAVADLGLTDLWVTVTHTHSGPGGYAGNLVAQLAGTGRLHRPTRDAVVAAAASALTAASRSLVPVSLRLGAVDLPDLVGARSAPASVDARLSRLVLEGASGPVAQLIVFSCHPTLVVRPPPGLDPDWPGRLSDAEAARGHGVTLVLQGAVGNVSVASRETNGERLPRFVATLQAAVDAVPVVPVASGLGVVRAVVGLPAPDASRLVPRLARPLADNFLCAASPAEAEVAILRLGPLLLVGVPGEPTAAAARLLEAAAGASRVVSLVDGYLGYVETPEHLAAGVGESERQLLGPGLLDTLVQGARAAGTALH